MTTQKAAALLLAAWACAAPLRARCDGGEDAWARGGRDFDGLSGRPAAPAVAGNLAGGPALAGLAAMDNAPKTGNEAAEKKVPSPEKKSSYWQYNDYAHSTGESIGMLALDIIAWVLAPIVVIAGILGVLFSFPFRK
ncbi:MAG: hypothetical protein Q8T11_00940 [Elusimicrobiota bacterium]|nr:hypothetical protein [Elusimicrobiota bacterium]